jgi:hypothetical protein
MISLPTMRCGLERVWLRAALSGQFQRWPKSQARRQHEQHIRAEVPPSPLYERRDPRLSDPQLFSRLALSPASVHH